VREAPHPSPAALDGRTIDAVSDAETRHVEIAGSPAQVWAFLWDAEALARVLPGCESLRADGRGRYAAVLRYPTPFLTVRADAEAELHDPVAPRSVVLVLDGTARGVGGSFHVRIPMTFDEMGSGTRAPGGAQGGPGGARTRVGYSVELRATGAIAGFGSGMLRDAITGQVQGLAADIEREIRAGRVPPPAGA
jgi:2-furoyl-CoA dehydrogenase large subunit